MRQNFLLVFFILINCFLSTLQAQHLEQLDSVFIDTKMKIPRKNSGKMVVKITSETFNRSQGKSVAEIVNEVSGIEINGSHSNEGQNLGYFVRGGRNRQVVIMVDGVQLNDPSSIANDYDLRLIDINTIEEIEIIKGASSVLYGSGAATAVISITTKKSSEKPISAQFTSTLGTNRAAQDENYKLEEFTNYAAVNGTLNKFFYHLSFGNRYFEGLSAIAAPDGESYLADIYNRFNGKFNFGINLNDHISFSQFFSMDKYKAGFDNFDYTDAENQNISEQLRTGGHLEWKFNKGFYVFNDNYSWLKRESISSFLSKYDARSYSIDNYVAYNFTKQITGLVGLSYNGSSFNSFSIPYEGSELSQDVIDDIANFDIIDPYLNITYISDFGLNTNAGIRLNNHSNYGSHLVYNLNPSFNFKMGNRNLKLFASYSTAYITPSLFQLYDPLYGKENLLPEENSTFEGGIEFFMDNSLRVSAAYFNRMETNYVDFVNVDTELYIYQYQNIDNTFNSSGVEIEVYKNFVNKISISANYTNTQADERFSQRIPEHKVNANFGYQMSSKTNFGLIYQFNSEREDSFFNLATFEAEMITLNSYGILDFSASHKLTKSLKLFAILSNIFNQEFEELYRYETRGRNIRVGFTMEF